MISNINFERAVISTILYDSRSFHEIQDIIKPADFIDPVTKDIFTLVETKLALGETLNDSMAMHEFPEHSEHIARDISGLPPLDTKTLISLSKQIVDLSKRRQIIAVLTVAMDDTKDGRVFDLSSLNEIDRASNSLITNEEHIAIYEDNIQNAKVCASTGIDDLDEIFTTAPGDLLVIAARPSMGKTSMVTSLIWKFLEQGEGSLFLSLEMAADKIMGRMIASRAAEPISNLNRNSVMNFDAVQKVKNELRNTDLFELSDLSMDESDVEHFVKQRVRKNPNIKHIFLDHLTFVKNNGKYQNEHLRIGAITKAFKRLAKELGIRFWILSQLSRSIESRPNKRPQLSDLRESGSIEEDADAVLTLYDEAYYTSKESGEKKPPITDVEIGVVKNRDGPTGTAHAKFNGPLVRFEPKGTPIFTAEYQMDEPPVDQPTYASPPVHDEVSINHETGEVFGSSLPGLDDMNIEMPAI